MSLKSHKTPWKSRPIAYCVSTFMSNLSCWLDHWLQKPKPFIPSYKKDMNQLLTLFESLGILPPPRSPPVYGRHHLHIYTYTPGTYNPCHHWMTKTPEAPLASWFTYWCRNWNYDTYHDNQYIWVGRCVFPPDTWHSNGYLSRMHVGNNLPCCPWEPRFAHAIWKQSTPLETLHQRCIWDPYFWYCTQHTARLYYLQRRNNQLRYSHIEVWGSVYISWLPWPHHLHWEQ